MSPVQAEKWLGCKRSWGGRALVRAARKREREIGKKFMVRSGSGKGLRYGFTRKTLQRYMPEFLDDKYSRTTESIRESLARVKAHIDEHVDNRIASHPVIRTMQKQAEETLELVGGLTMQVERLAAARSKGPAWATSKRA